MFRMVELIYNVQEKKNKNKRDSRVKRGRKGIVKGWEKNNTKQ